jgi:hypothetical protein
MPYNLNLQPFALCGSDQSLEDLVTLIRSEALVKLTERHRQGELGLTVYDAWCEWAMGLVGWPS